MSFIECDNLVKIYKVADLEVVALQGLDLTVEQGEMIALIGPSGSGKSTLMNVLGGLDVPSAGRVSVGGNPVKMTSHEYRLLAYLMHHTGRVVSRTELVEHLYDQDFDRDSNTIEVFVGRIRKKLDVDIIQTVRGLGYLLTPPANAR